MSAAASSNTQAPANGPEVSDLERYKVVTSQLQHLNDKILESFKLYIQLLIAITAGYVWLRTQPNAQEMLWARPVVPTLTVFVGFTTVLLIVFNLRSWWGYRHAESSLSAGSVGPPTFPRSASQELIFIGVVIVTTIGAVWYFAQ